jgi:hypothetical protein
MRLVQDGTQLVVQSQRLVLNTQIDAEKRAICRNQQSTLRSICSFSNA